MLQLRPSIIRLRFFHPYFARRATLISFVFLVPISPSLYGSTDLVPSNIINVWEITNLNVSVILEKLSIGASSSLQFWNFEPVNAVSKKPARFDYKNNLICCRDGIALTSCKMLSFLNLISSKSTHIFFRPSILGQPEYVHIKFVGFIWLISVISSLVASLTPLENCTFGYDSLLVVLKLWDSVHNVSDISDSFLIVL